MKMWYGAITLCTTVRREDGTWAYRTVSTTFFLTCPDDWSVEDIIDLVRRKPEHQTYLELGFQEMLTQIDEVPERQHADVAKAVRVLQRIPYWFAFAFLLTARLLTGMTFIVFMR